MLSILVLVCFMKIDPTFFGFGHPTLPVIFVQVVYDIVHEEKFFPVTSLVEKEREGALNPGTYAIGLHLCTNTQSCGIHPHIMDTKSYEYQMHHDCVSNNVFLKLAWTQ